MLCDVGGQHTVAEHCVVEVKVALLLVVRLLHLLTPMLVLGECVALITDTDIGALQVLTGPVGQAQPWVLAALVYVLALPAAHQTMSLGTKTSVGTIGIDAVTPNAGRREVTFINVLTMAPVPGQMIAREALALEGAWSVRTDAIVAHIPSLTLIFVHATPAVWRGLVSLGARATEGTRKVLTPSGRTGAAFGALVDVTTGPAPLAAIAGLAGDALKAARFVFTFAIGAGARVATLVDVFTHGRSGGFEPVAGIAVAFIVTREIDAEAAVAAQVRLGALVQVHARASPCAHVEAVASVAVTVIGAPSVHADAFPGATRLRLALIHINAVAVLRM